MLALTTVAGEAAAAISAGERQALLDLYASSNGAGWTNGTNWNGAAGSAGTWFGVTCDAGKTTVQHLNLHSNNLVGTLPASLANLATLQSLYLYSNRLVGSIPISIGNLTNLQGLYLYSNRLSGSIPGELGNLTNLVGGLYLSANQLTGPIPASLGNLTKVQYLFLYSNQLTGPIPTQLGSLTSVKQLILCSNQLVGPVPSSIASLTNLSSGASDLRWNGLYSADPALVTFLDGKQAGGDWQSTQTVPVTGLGVGPATISSVPLTWSPIAYAGDTGGYQVLSATMPGGPYTLSTTTADKAVASATVNDLGPGTPYYFLVRSVTNPHAKNQNTVVSDPSAEVSATTLGHRVKLRRHLKRTD